MPCFIRNKEKNGIEIYFEGKPDEDIRYQLKENKWRWNSSEKCWYNKYSEENELFAKAICSDVEDTYTDGDTCEPKRKSGGEKDAEKNKSIFGAHPDCLKNRAQMKGVLSDYFLGDKLKVNTLLAAYDMGVHIEIKKAKEIDNLFRGKYRKKLVDEYGLSIENADEALMLWIEEYGGKYLDITLNCKDLEIPDLGNEEATPNRKPRNVNNPKNKPLRNPSKKPVNITTLARGEKLPKTILIRDKATEETFGVDDVRISIFKGYSRSDHLGINVVGELEGSAKFGGWAMIVMVVHNENGEPIGMSSSVTFKPEELNGNYSFEMNIYIPTDELISDILFRLTYDPCFC